QKELDANFAAARQRFAGELASLLPTEGVKQETAERLPYKEYKLSTGLTIFVGRDGSDNDRTTFDFARPYELWFHTQQCPGSHVVMKYPNKSFEPSKREIEETAAIAAFFSKAKNDSLVPVVYTEKRYVRKPRKAKPGLVTVEREKSVMVEPTRPRE
ncbi:MAG TPA: NFACT RNA binding domain-containing protein, partial [candidate division Zixibacteria bacterium]|nr:NFACT RNA binding domain-containing protein [candidate division Zixibacteria bacterium]